MRPAPRGNALLRELLAEAAFAPTPDGADLARYYLPFGRLLGGRARPELVFGECARRGGRAALVGRRGVGKSSLIQHVLTKLDDGYAPIPVRAHAEGGLVEDPLAFARHVLRSITRAAAEAEALTEAERWAALAEAEGNAPPTTRTAFRVGAPVWLLRADVAREVTVTADRPAPATVSEVLRVVEDVLAVVDSYDLVPILVFDDTDRWVTVHGSDPTPRVAAFFGVILPTLVDLPAGMVVAVHDSYRRLDAYREPTRGLFDHEIPLPALDRPEQLEAVLGRRVEHHAPGVRPGDVVSGDAVAALFEHYEGPAERRLREVIQGAQLALGVACQDGADRIEREAVESVLAPA